MPPRVFVIGAGPGSPDFVAPAARKQIKEAEVLVGAGRLLATWSHAGQETYRLSADLDAAVRFIREAARTRTVAVLVSGDPGIFSFAAYLKRHLPEEILEFTPGISSVQLMFARLRLSWHDARVVSLHGRPREEAIEPAVRGIFARQPVALLGDPSLPPGDAAADLLARGVPDLEVAVGDQLSYDEERLYRGSLSGLAEAGLEYRNWVLVVPAQAPCVVPAQAPCHESPLWPFQTPGIPDDLFAREPEIPMTRSEVRTVTLAKLRLASASVVYDIGAGTGSIAVECALLADRGTVYAVEREARACDLLDLNVLRFGVANLLVVKGTAPEALDRLPPPDRVVIGGSGGRLREILDRVTCVLGPGGRLVVNAVTPATVSLAMDMLGGPGYRELETICLNVARTEPAGRTLLWKAGNPVYVISATRTGGPGPATGARRG